MSCFLADYPARLCLPCEFPAHVSHDFVFPNLCSSTLKRGLGIEAYDLGLVQFECKCMFEKLPVLRIALNFRNPRSSSIVPTDNFFLNVMEMFKKNY
jgi:hypothetical protein